LKEHDRFRPGTGNLRLERELNYREARALEHCLSAAVVPLMPTFAMGLDGTGWELRIENGWNTLRIRWWPALPAEWESLRPVVEHLAMLAEFPPELLRMHKP
jgi:hypothetical protein